MRSFFSGTVLVLALAAASAEAADTARVATNRANLRKEPRNESERCCVT